MIPVIIWGGTQTGANSLKQHLRWFNNETKEYRLLHKDNIVLELKDPNLIKKINDDQWSYKYFLRDIDNIEIIFNKNLIIRLHHSFFSYDELDKICKAANENSYKHIFLYRESLFDQALGWYHEDYGTQYEEELPQVEMGYTINNFRDDLFYTYNYIKDKVNLNTISYETLYIRREKDKIRKLLKSLGFSNISENNINKLIFGRYKHIKQGPKFKIDEEKGPILESIKHSYKKNFDILNDIYCDEKIKL